MLSLIKPLCLTKFELYTENTKGTEILNLCALCAFGNLSNSLYIELN